MKFLSFHVFELGLCDIRIYILLLTVLGNCKVRRNFRSKAISTNYQFGSITYQDIVIFLSNCWSFSFIIVLWNLYFILIMMVDEMIPSRIYKYLSMRKSRWIAHWIISTDFGYDDDEFTIGLVWRSSRGSEREVQWRHTERLLCSDWKGRSLMIVCQKSVRDCTSPVLCLSVPTILYTTCH